MPLNSPLHLPRCRFNFFLKKRYNGTGKDMRRFLLAIDSIENGLDVIEWYIV